MVMETVMASVGERERTNKEVVLRDFVRFSWKATRGLTEAAEGEGRDLVRRMVDSERVTAEEGDRLLVTLTARMRMSRQVFEEKVDSSVRKAVEKLAAISGRELTRLSEQVVEAERRLERLKSTRPGK
jgi:polyhydroxyalkanoate synthesis regulator phasin